MDSEQNKTEMLETAPVGKVFFKYLIPSLTGMMLMALNIVVDGIMVGNRLGPVALAGVGLASPVFTLFLATSLWIGIGGATLFSQAMGERKAKYAQFIFTHSLVLIAGITIIIGLTAFTFQEQLAYMLGSNEETFPYTIDYLNIMLLFGFFFTLENALSTFVRNDQNPNLAMIALVITALSNIGINYYFLYVLNLGVASVAFGTIIASFLGILVLVIHFFRKTNNLRFVPMKFERSLFKNTITVGFPSFLSEVGISVFTVAFNVTLSRIAGTAGLAAFSVLNYVHGVMLMMFLGLGSAVQPLISYYHGAKTFERQRETMKIALRVALLAGAVAFVIGQLGAPQIVSIFGDFPEEIKELAVTGIRLFFTAYIFMGINFVMMTYFQSVAQIRMATWITASREIIFMMIFILVLPLFLGINGVWISVPLAELVVMITILIHVKRNREFRRAF
ncbi:putative MATE family efflux protein [Virgibacillus natechei]|uniref:Multidrug export protein MepA n=1 Tax=Virgibacillus natechei TaxID=1216297 RepID=A0ABS4IBK7_9BACI|nr:MATE family efflux transporter [Virgibacillus natechei]MBP1968314.1 putative MATE family efflux protein [Virgibacillus natechei]UZD13449.1 MATE family efflux transporter [Virgibacillus natechei]